MPEITPVEPSGAQMQAMADAASDWRRERYDWSIPGSVRATVLNWNDGSAPSPPCHSQCLLIVYRRVDMVRQSDALCAYV